jgi:hypothetical protein
MSRHTPTPADERGRHWLDGRPGQDRPRGSVSALAVQSSPAPKRAEIAMGEGPRHGAGARPRDKMSQQSEKNMTVGRATCTAGWKDRHTSPKQRRRELGVLPSDRVEFYALPPRPFSPYIGGAGLPAMAINGRRNKPFGPGGSTRRLHHQGSAVSNQNEPASRRRSVLIAD